MQSSREVLAQLITFDTTSRNSNLALIDWAAERLDSAGARIRLTYNTDHTKANMLATLGPDIEGGVILSGHTDVVPVDGQSWTSNPFVLTERAGRLYGRGTSDMKGFIASCLAAAPHWAAARLRRPIHLALSYDEEVGCCGVPSLIDDMTANVPCPALAIIGEPTDMTLGVSHAGVKGSTTAFKGIAAHASDPSKGLNAIVAAAHFIQHLRLIEQQIESEIRGATLNVGQIAGGAAINIVAENCEVRWEYRSTNEDSALFVQDRVDAYLGRARSGGISITSDEIMKVPSFRSRFDDAMLKLMAACGAKAQSTVLPFGSEAGLFELAGVPAIVCGPGSIDQAHRPDEWIHASALAEADRFIHGVGLWASSIQG